MAKYIDKQLTGLRPGSIFLVALALSIGWGIRGNFGHEYGAMIPGALAAIAACLVSGRGDWRERVAYFGLFGALGWGFGGSISYMQVIAYTHSGHFPSQVYGFLGLFLIGYLWGAMGGAGTAFPAVANRDRMTEIIKPLIWILIAWTIQWRFEEWLQQWESSFDATWKRQEAALYWLDADWFAALTALAAMCLYDLAGRWRGIPLLGALMASGALAGWIVQGILELTGLSRVITWLVVWPQGHVPTITRMAAEQGKDPEAALGAMLYNWPNFLMNQPWMAGMLAGAVIGAVIYFRRWGRFASGASLFVHMSAGWLLSFLLLPVLLGFGGAGLRLTPPRSDDWAGILGVCIATMWWLRKNQLLPVVYAMTITGTIGGLGFAGAAWLKLMLVAMGNKNLVDPATAEAWNHWQSANWHSFLEQSYGFINGIGIALALGLLARRTGAAPPGRVARPWTEIFAVGWVLFGVGWINIQKNLRVWVEEAQVVPGTMKAPLFGAIELGATVWFALGFWAIALAVIYLMFRHKREPLAMLPHTAVGKGQLFFLVFLWAVVIANFERALPGFEQGRLLTEWVIIINAAIASVLVLTLPRLVDAKVPELGLLDYGPSFARVRLGLAAALVVVGVVFPWTIAARYQGKPAGHAGQHTRFGDDAGWKTQPILKGEKHK